MLSYYMGGSSIIAIYIIIIVIGLAITAGVTVWVYRDAIRRDMDGALWVAIILLSGCIGSLIYLIVRKDHPYVYPSHRETHREPTEYSPNLRPRNNLYPTRPSQYYRNHPNNYELSGQKKQSARRIDTRKTNRTQNQPNKGEDRGYEYEYPKEIYRVGTSTSTPPKFCPKCGEKILSEARFCPYCGFKIHK